MAEIFRISGHEACEREENDENGEHFERRVTERSDSVMSAESDFAGADLYRLPSAAGVGLREGDSWRADQSVTSSTNHSRNGGHRRRDFLQ
jgi:hypothetical protein